MPVIKNRANEFQGRDFAPVATYKVAYKDVFSLNYLYFLLHEWFVDEGWVNRDKDEEFPEVYYLQRDHPQSGQEIWVRWRLKKDAGKLYRNYMDIDIHVMGLKDVEVLLNGQKVRANKGEVEIQVKAIAQTDPDKVWENHPFLKHFKSIILYRILGRNFSSQKAKLYGDAYDLQTAIKTYLRLQSYGGEPEARMFFAKKDVA